MNYWSLNLDERLNTITEHWSPKVIARMNDCLFKLVKLQGEFVWHSHKETDEVFIALHGAMRIEFRDGCVELKSGEMFVVPQGIEHRTAADRECHAMLVEPAGTVNTGEVVSELTAPVDDWI